MTLPHQPKQPLIASRDPVCGTPDCDRSGGPGVSMRTQHLRACALPGWPTHILVISSSVGHRRAREPMLPPVRRISEAWDQPDPTPLALAVAVFARHRLTGRDHENNQMLSVSRADHRRGVLGHCR